MALRPLKHGASHCWYYTATPLLQTRCNSVHGGLAFDCDDYTQGNTPRVGYGVFEAARDAKGTSQVTLHSG